MSQQKVFVTGPILDSVLIDGEDPFVNFQTNPPKDGNENLRHYFESVAATTEVNRNLYQFEPKALRMLARGFKERITLTINHEKGNYDNTLGFGATVDAVFMDERLYVAAYISLNKTYPKGPFGNSEELRDGIIDGFINSVSQSVYALKSKCSVCNLPYPQHYRDYENQSICRHYRGQQVVVEKNGQKVVETVHIIVQEAEPIELSLVQMGADRGNGVTKKAINLSLSDFVDEERFNFLHGDESQRGRIPEDPDNSPTDSGDDPPNSDNGGEEPTEPTDSGEEPTDPNNQGESEMSNEALKSMQTRAETAETNATNLQEDLDKVKGEKAVIESQSSAHESKISSLEAEKKALETQVTSANNERDTFKTQLDSANEGVKTKDTEIAALKKTAADNEVVIADGIAARAEYEEAYVTAYVGAVGDDCSDEDRELQVETAKSFTIEVLKKKTKGFDKAKAENYPGGKTVNEGEEPAPEEKKSYPIGVS